MRNISLHIAFAALLSLLSLASCSRNDQVTVPNGEEGKVYVTLTLSINGEEAESRVTWDSEQDTDEEGVGWENEINNLQILIYDENDTYAGTVESLFGSGDRYIGTLSGTNWQSGTYKFVVLANFTATSTNPALADLASITYNQAAAYLPMYGVKRGTFTFEAGENTDIGSIDLLRAMAKVEVSFSEGFPTDYTIGNISLSPYNTQGYCVPQGYASVDNTGALDREEAGTAYSFNPYHPSASTSALTFKEENGKYYLYLPEYDNSTDAATIQVTVNGETYPLEFKNYENGVPTGETPYDIVRNHIYRYTITGVNDGKLTVKYRVLLWDKVESQIGWNPILPRGSNAPMTAWRLGLVEGYTEDDVEDKVKGCLKIDSDHKNAKNGDEEAAFCYVLYPRYDSQKDTEGNALHRGLENKPSYAGFYFCLKEPTGAIWEAYLTKPEYFALNENGEYDIDGDDVKERKCAVRGIARDDPYQIQVYPRYPWTVAEFPTNNDGSFIDGVDAANTHWGNEWESSGKSKNLYTDLYIRISTDGGNTWNYLDINPKDRWDKTYDGIQGYIEHTYWGERRFAGGDNENGGSYIRIWQLKAKCNKPYDELVENLDASWGIKDFWDEYDKPSE